GCLWLCKPLPSRLPRLPPKLGKDQAVARSVREDRPALLSPPPPRRAYSENPQLLGAWPGATPPRCAVLGRPSNAVRGKPSAPFPRPLKRRNRVRLFVANGQQSCEE